MSKFTPQELFIEDLGAVRGGLAAPDNGNHPSLTAAAYEGGGHPPGPGDRPPVLTAAAYEGGGHPPSLGDLPPSREAL